MSYGGRKNVKGLRVQSFISLYVCDKDPCSQTGVSEMLLAAAGF